MNFPTIKQDPCPSEIPGSGGASGDIPSLLIKPGMVVACAGEVQFRAYLRTDNGGEMLLSTDLTFATSSPTIATIDATTGLATLLAEGVASISVTFGTMVANAQIQVMGDGEDCCSEQKVASLLLLDNSKSMALPSVGGSRLELAKAMAIALLEATRWEKDVAGVSSFALALTEFAAIGSTQPSDALVLSIPQTAKQTNFLESLSEAIEVVSAETSDRKILVIFSDGENRPTADGVIPNPADVIALASEFKADGGVIICFGTSAAGDGFALLQSLASGGFFLNAYDADTLAAAQTALIAFLCSYCGGLPESYGFCSSEPPAAQIPAPSPVPDTEATSVSSYTATKRACVYCDGDEPATPVTGESEKDVVTSASRRLFNWDLTSGVPRGISVNALNLHPGALYRLRGSATSLVGTVNSGTLLTSGTVTTAGNLTAEIPSAGGFLHFQLDLLNTGNTETELSVQNASLLIGDGQPMCAEATRVSYVSQSDADALAQAAAEAAAALLCGTSNNTRTIQFANGTLAPASPYPSVKQVSGVSGLITKVTVKLNSVKRSDGSPMMLVLRSPQGTAVMLAYVTADSVSRPFNGVQIVLDDAAPTAIPFDTGSGAIAAGTYKPTVLESGQAVQMPSPSPLQPYAVLLSAFIGEDPNGQWALYAAHKNYFSLFNPANYQLIGGWDLTITSA